jgi:hypothetical protein
MTKTIIYGIVVFTVLAASVIALIVWERYPAPERIKIMRDVFECKDRLYFEMLVRYLDDDAQAYSDEHFLSLLRDAGCKTLGKGTVVIVKEWRGFNGGMRPSLCVQEQADSGCRWIVDSHGAYEMVH